MEKFLKLVMKRKISTERVDAMADGVARAALDKRFGLMMDQQANKPAPLPRSFAPLSNPLDHPVVAAE
jgi:hypothetical protein